VKKTAQWELHNLYSSPNIILVIIFKENKVGGVCSRYGGEKGAYRILVGRTE
jgi:hypothetical protein